MGLSLIRSTATIAPGGNYTPNGLLSGFFVLTLQGDATINAPTSVGAGEQIAIKIILPNGQCRLIWNAVFVMGNEQDIIWTGGIVTLGFFCEGGSYMRIWSGGS